MKKSYFIYPILVIIFLVGCAPTQQNSVVKPYPHQKTSSSSVVMQNSQPQGSQSQRTQPQNPRPENTSQPVTIPEISYDSDATIISLIKLWDHPDHTRLTITFAGNLPQHIDPEPSFEIKIQKLVLANRALESKLCRSIKSSKSHHEIACKHKRFGDVKIFVTPNSIKIETPPGVKSYSSKQLDNPYRISYNLYDSAAPPPSPPLIPQEY
ncbi:hypothetical protein TI05_15940 [Achromatium sp. WMS3]|nr:hypothetical protein TI05_15940 [Achromatium sp. WMS3]